MSKGKSKRKNNGCWARAQLAIAVVLILMIVALYAVLCVSSMFYRFPG